MNAISITIIDFFADRHNSVVLDASVTDSGFNGTAKAVDQRGRAKGCRWKERRGLAAGRISWDHPSTCGSSGMEPKWFG